ncbi:hypothetical protein [Streptomyces sp. NPDC097619]|uniref:hypothetical protein n=1 Tax=Streptomyces sp. NPDC097619 TaxID=3157228 RepID=UPI0033171786
MMNFFRRRSLAGLERALKDFLEDGERLQYQCTCLVGETHEALRLRQGELISTVVSDQAVYLLFNSRRPPEATRLSFDEIQRVAQTTERSILIETWDETDYVLAPQSAQLTKTTANLANELLARASDHVVAEHRIDLLPDGRGMTLFQLRTPYGEVGYRWSLAPDPDLLAVEAEPHREAVRERVAGIVQRAETGTD